MTERSTVLVLLASALATLSCDAGSGAGDDVATAFALPLPGPVLAARAVEREGLDVVVTFDGVAAAVTRDAQGGASATGRVPVGRKIAAEVTWVDRSGPRTVPVFALSALVGPISDDETVFVERGYETLDADGDGVSNFDELANPEELFPARGTLFAGLEVPEAIRIPRLDASLSPPVINGNFDEDAVWDLARSTDGSGENGPLYIDRLLIDEGTQSGAQRYRWLAMHDGEFLYMAVLFEGARDDRLEDGSRDARTPFRDSGPILEDDDGLALFFDGDGSRRLAHDGVDDIYLRIPQVVSPDTDGEGVVARFPFAPDRRLPENLEVASCVCRAGTSAWELKIPLSLIGAEVGRPFGLEVQIDQDVDGGARDARWGWANPAADEHYDYFRFESPRFSRMAVLTEETLNAQGPAPPPSRSGALVSRHAGKCLEAFDATETANGRPDARQSECTGDGAHEQRLHRDAPSGHEAGSG